MIRIHAATRSAARTRRAALIGMGMVFATVVPFCGCSAWKENTSHPLQLPTPKAGQDVVAMEITFVRVPVGKQAIEQTLWEQVDEQCVDATARAALNENGFRVGLVGSQLPDVLRKMLDEQQQQKHVDRVVDQEMDVLAQNRHIQNRLGQRSEIVASAPQDEIIVLYRPPNESRVEGKPLRDAQCVLASRMYAQADGRIRVELIPEVHHGQPRKQWVAGEGTFHLLSGRERQVFEELKIDTPLTAGQTLIISCTADHKGLGQNFFVDGDRGAHQQKIFLIRLAQTRQDDLFAP